MTLKTLKKPGKVSQKLLATLHMLMKLLYPTVVKLWLDMRASYINLQSNPLSRTFSQKVAQEEGTIAKMQSQIKKLESSLVEAKDAAEKAQGKCSVQVSVYTVPTFPVLLLDQIS